MILVRGECSRCGELIPYGVPDDNYPANLFLTVPGRGAFAGTIWQAELICKNQMLCTERQTSPSDATRGAEGTAPELFPPGSNASGGVQRTEEQRYPQARSFLSSRTGMGSGGCIEKRHMPAMDG